MVPQSVHQSYPVHSSVICIAGPTSVTSFCGSTAGTSLQGQDTAMDTRGTGAVVGQQQLGFRPRMAQQEGICQTVWGLLCQPCGSLLIYRPKFTE